MWLFEKVLKFRKSVLSSQYIILLPFYYTKTCTVLAKMYSIDKNKTLYFTVFFTNIFAKYEKSADRKDQINFTSLKLYEFVFLFLLCFKHPFLTTASYSEDDRFINYKQNQ